MTMRVEISINGNQLAHAEVVNTTADATQPVNSYEWTFYGEGVRTLSDTLEHRRDDGAVVLAATVLEHIARRYKVANAVRRGEELTP